MDLLNGISDWELMPDEIIIVDSSTESSQVKKSASHILEKYAIEFKIIQRSLAYPGCARNIGVKVSRGEYLAFLDVTTIPPKNWLYLAIVELSNHPEANGMYGSTQYTATKYFSKLVRLATYGVYPLQTLPASVIRRDTMCITGQFIETTRAGEDTDWMTRVNIHRLYLLKSNSTVYYDGLDNLTLKLLLKKWFRNYKHSAKLPYLYAHKSIYYHALVIFLLIMAFNWNWVVAGWNTESEFYIPHFTKIIFFLILISYACIRGVLIPIKKGASLTELLPLKWILVLGISALLDITKLLAFARGRWMRE